MTEEICMHCRRPTQCHKVGVNMLCEDHKHLKQYQPKKSKIKPLKPRSIKRAKQEVEYTKVSKEYLETHEDCEVCINEGQEVAKSDQVHHKKGRIEDLLTDKRYFLACCDDCHKQVESDPLWAKQNGYSIDRL